MDLSVIIPCFNAGDTIGMQLDALASQEWSKPWEIIIADNGSTDNTLAIVQEYQQKMPHLRIVDASSKSGAAHARNIGAKNAKSESLAFCDADDVISSGWVAAMGEALEKYEYVGGRNEHWKLNKPWLVEMYGCEEGDGVFFDHPYLPLVSGNNFGVKRKLHEGIGGFDEKLLRLQDVDYAWRLQEAGAEIHEIKEAVIHFRFRETILDTCRRAWQSGSYEALLYKKHRPMGMPQLIYWTTLLKTAIMFPVWFVVRVRDKASLVKLLGELCWRAGQFWGCVQHSYLPI